MKILAKLTLISTFLLSQSAHAYTQVFVVRHAEKKDESKDPGLSEAGQKRAQSLASLLKDSGVSAIYSSDMQRTQKTAEPLAAALKLKTIVVSGSDVSKMVKALQDDKSSGAALVVGHSNTVPEILKALGANGNIAIADNEFSRLFLLVPVKGSAPVLATLSY